MLGTHYWEKLNHVKFGHMKKGNKRDFTCGLVWYLNVFQGDSYKIIKKPPEILLQNTIARF